MLRNYARVIAALTLTALAIVVSLLLLSGPRAAQATLPAAHPSASMAVDGSMPFFISSLTLPKVITTVQLPEAPLWLDYPEVGVNPATGYVYIPSMRNNIVVILSDTHVVTAISTGQYPVAVDVNPITGYIYVANEIDCTATVLSMTQIITTFNAGVCPTEVAVNSSNGYIYLGSEGGNTVGVLSGAQFVTAVIVGRWPARIGVNPNTGYAYVAVNNNGTVTILSGTQIILNQHYLGPATQQVGVNPATGYAYISYSGAAAVLSGTERVATLPMEWVSDIEANPTTGYVYFTQPFSNQVTIVSGTQVITSAATNAGPLAIGVNPTSGYVYVTNRFSNTVTIFCGTQILSVLDVGIAPWSIGINPTRGRVYVVNAADYTVSVIQEPIVPKSLTPRVLSSSIVDIVIDFSEPIVTSTIQLTVSPAIPITVTWSALLDRAIIQHAPFQPKVEYTVQVLSGGQTLSGAGIFDRDFTFVYYPFRTFLPTMLKNR